MIIWANLQFTGSKPLYIASYYCPPTNKPKSLEEMTKSLSIVMNKHCRSQPNIVIAGDFNFPDIDWNSCTTSNPNTASVHRKLLDMLLEHSLVQLVNQITRPISNSILDLIITTNAQLVTNIDSNPGISDHNLITFNINMKPKRQIKPSRKLYNFNKVDTDQLKQRVKQFTEEFLLSDPSRNSVDTNWSKIRDNLYDILNACVPSKWSKAKRHLPWISTNLKRQMRKRDRLYRKAHKLQNNKAWHEFRQFRNHVAKAVHRARCNYMYVNSVIGASLAVKPKTFWSYVKLMRTENLGIPTLRSTTKLCTTDKDKAETLNEYFQSVFTQEADQNIPDNGNSPYHSTPNIVIHVGIPGVEKQLAALNPSKACGPDELPPKLLKSVAHEIAPALAFLFQQSYNTGIIPTQWKRAIVTSIYKKGPKSDPSNYRPISLTCICCKVMEHIILSHIAKHLNDNNILLDSQHGFREKLSTATQLISVTHDWALTLHNRGQTDVIFLDFSKAFDKVPHHHLSTKLQFYGIRGRTVNWIRAFLSDREQAVSVNGTFSSWGRVTSGVPQGSVLGPVLFLLYINDIQDQVQSTMRLFADDSVIYRKICCQEDHFKLQQDMAVLADWSTKWLMHFNIKNVQL